MLEDEANLAQIPKSKLESKNHDLENEGTLNESEPQGKIIEFHKVKFRQLSNERAEI
jgi:hypothetical protein